MLLAAHGQLLRRRHETHRPQHHASDAVDAVEVDHCAMRVPALLNARTAGGCCQRRIQRPSCPSSWNPPNRGRLHSCRTAERWSSTQGPDGPTAEQATQNGGARRKGPRGRPRSEVEKDGSETTDDNPCTTCNDALRATTTTTTTTTDTDARRRRRSPRGFQTTQPKT